MLWDKYSHLQGGFVQGVDALSQSPEMFEIKKLYQNVEFKAIDAEKGLFEVKNKFLFTNLSEFEVYWRQSSDKGMLRDGVTEIDVKPGQKGILDLELNKITNTECYLYIGLRTKTETSWCKPEHIVGEQQFIINEFENVYDELEEDGELVVADTYGALRIFCDDISVRFERRSKNQLSSIRVGDEEILNAPVRLNFWRALTDNDRRSKAGTRLGCWRSAGEADGADYSIEGYKILNNGKRIIVTCGAVIHTQPDSKATMVYTITSKGIEVNMQFITDDSLPEIPEVSMLFELPADFEDVTYLGAGPDDNYIDRKSEAKIGVWKSNASKMPYRYDKPQECGNRTGVRYATLVGDKKVFTLIAEPVMELNVNHYLPLELESAGGYDELPEVNKTVVRAIARQQGVGAYGKTDLKCNEKYLNKSGKIYRLKFQIRF